MVNLDIQRLNDANIYDQENNKIGSVGGIYFDDQSDNPTFVTVKTGLFGSNETFIPIDQVEETEDGFRVPFTKDFVKDAPNIEADGHLSTEDERRIYEYYQRDYTPRGGVPTGGLVDDRNEFDRDAVDYDRRDGDFDRNDLDGDRADLNDGESLVAHEEHLKVGKETRDAENVRLHKRVIEDTETVQVPVEREELVIDREKIDPNSAEAHTGEIGTETDETITLREERPVVDKETIATEKVNVGKESVIENETVTGDVRREEIDVERDGDIDRENNR